MSRLARSLPRPCVIPAGLRRAAVTRSFAAALAAVAVLPAAASAAVERTETPIASLSPESDVAASLVRIHVPLPASAAKHPAACDWLQYVRYRSVNGPTDPMQDDAVAVLNPGILEGAMALDPLARNSVRAAERRGRHIEVWAIDRRSNCLEDHTGTDLMEKTGNWQDAVDYYFHKKPIDGRTFAGFDTDTRVLADIGLKQMVTDYYSVLTNELPDQTWREHHVLCGGHSIGGPLTQVFAGWDFDGDTKTTTDAGYRQCAGFVGFESMLDLDPTEDYATLKKWINTLFLRSPNVVRNLGEWGIPRGLLPRRVPIDGADPVSATVMKMIGIKAWQDPHGLADPLVAAVPYNKQFDAYLHTLGSPSVNDLLFTHDSLRDYSYTYAGLLGQLMDDNGSVFSPNRASFGFFTGAPMRRNLLAANLSKIPGASIAIQQNNLFLPFKKKAGTLPADWVNYNQLGPDQIGPGKTNPGTEVTDARDMARIQFEGPSDFTDPYFPMRVVTDLTSFYGHDTKGSLSGFKYRHPMAKKPRMDANGGSGVAKKSGFGSPDPAMLLPGYEHVDSVTAAEQQNNGQPEGSSTMLVDMVDKVVPR